MLEPLLLELEPALSEGDEAVLVPDGEDPKVETADGNGLESEDKEAEERSNVNWRYEFRSCCAIT